MHRQLFLAILGMYLGVLTNPVHAVLLLPDDFLTAGHFTNVAGDYSLDTDSVEITGPGGFQVSGVLSNGIAVFAFDSFNLAAGASFTTIGTKPAAILSTTDIFIGGGGVQVLSGGGTGGEPRQRGQGPGGGFPGFDFFGGAGGGGGFGGSGGRGQFNDPTFSFPGAGGPSYGNLEDSLQGGSAGGGGKENIDFESAGGALELGASRKIEISSVVAADGQPGQPRGLNHSGGGGGSGGGLLLHAPVIKNTGLLSAIGGYGGDGVFENGGGGGGGRILIDTMVSRFENVGNLSVNGGSAPSDFFGAGMPGQSGIITIRATLVPEPTAFQVAIMFVIVLNCSWRLRYQVAI